MRNVFDYHTCVIKPNRQNYVLNRLMSELSGCTERACFHSFFGSFTQYMAHRSMHDRLGIFMQSTFDYFL